ncbi:hypothetical protein [Arenibacter latericius]|uniref:hypothetical protein n=1 Tax=Arenibacter latericius TaxID=86104 RepID=UPI00041C2749|nr:hypothetical protein [Arenibacter latericius]MDX1362814.1 hypothetical protein [Arenibacter latericius]
MAKIKKQRSQAVTEVYETIKPVPPKETAHSIRTFEITTDSVVAKATIVTDTETRRINIDWGDGQNDTINLVPGRPFDIDRFSVGVGSEPVDPLPEGTYEIYHAYDEPEDKRSFDHIVLVNVENKNGGNDIRLREISLIPRYRIVHYQTRFQLPEGCDVGQEMQKFKVVISIGGVPIHEYPDIKIKNNPAGSVIWHLLEGSQLAQELSYGTPYDGSLLIRYDFTEEDFWLNDHGTVSINNHILPAESGLHETQFSLSDYWGESCRVRLRLDREVTLISNIPHNSAPSTFKAKL